MLNPLLKKELHLLKGPIIASSVLLLLLWITHVLLPFEFWPGATWPLGLYALLLSYIITMAFGVEISEGSFGCWLAQPRSRKDLWKEKLKLTTLVYLASSLAIGFLILWIDSENQMRLLTGSMGIYLIYIVLASFGPGIYYTLKFKHPIASFWLTVVSIPIVIALSQWTGDLLFLHKGSSPGIRVGTYSTPFAKMLYIVWCHTCLAAYGLWGFWAARRAFLNWEDQSNQETTISLGLKRTSPNTAGAATMFRHRSSLATMLMREIRLQQQHLLGAILMVGIAFAIYYWAQSLPTTTGEQRDFKELLALLPFVFRYLLFIAPLSIAAVSIAEGRRQDVHTWELVLPVSSRKQFAVKAISVVFLSWLMTAGIPMYFDHTVLFAKYDPLPKSIAIILTHACAIIVGCLSFYVSSMSRGYLKAFSYSLGLLPLLAFFWIFQIQVETLNNLGPFLGWFTVPVILMLLWIPCLLVWSYRNFKTPQILRQHKLLNLKRWGWSSIAVTMWIVFMIDRTWERFILIEPKAEGTTYTSSIEDLDLWRKEHLFATVTPNGDAKHLVTISQKVDWRRNGTALILKSDGKAMLISDSFFLDWDRHREEILSGPQTFLLNFPTETEAMNAQWVFGSQFASGAKHRFIIDFSGHLWKWSLTDERSFIQRGMKLDHVITPEPILSNKRFRNLIAIRGDIAALDDNNILWMTYYPRIQNGKRYSNHMSDWRSIFEEHQWKEFIITYRGFLGLKHDGTLWTHDGTMWHVQEGSTTDFKWSLDTAKTLIPVFKDQTFETIRSNYETCLLERSDGTLWTDASLIPKTGERTPSKKTELNLLCQFKSPDDISQFQTTTFISGFREVEKINYIKANGTLWQGDPHFIEAHAETSTPPSLEIQNARQIGSRSDWVFVGPYGGMTADGKIWNWNQRQTNPWNPFPGRFRHKMVADMGK